VTFETLSGIQTPNISKTLIHSAYDKVQSNNDLALVWLTDTAPMDAIRYDIYRGSDEIGQSFTMVGVAKPLQGVPDQPPAAPPVRFGSRRKTSSMPTPQR
jgi:hypothetical protein